MSAAEAGAWWAASGAMALTGRSGAPPLGPPAPLVPHLAAVLLGRGARRAGRTVDLDPVALLGERAALAGLERRGDTSCGGSTRLLPVADGWLAVSLARPDDVDAVPAWLELDGAFDAIDPWATIGPVVAGRHGHDLVERAGLLGLPVSALPAEAAGATSARRSAARFASLPVPATAVAGPPRAPRPLTDLLVVDLSALWAGPLCAGLLGSAGARVVKVESTRRPDGARSGPAAFFDLLNAGKRSVALDLRSRHGVGLLHRLLQTADVVVEASRPRALEQMGIVAAELLGRGGPSIWVSITGYGRTGGARERVAFGDDAAVAGGLVVRDAVGPCFCADAIADPTTGLIAAAAVLEALAAGGRWLLDVAMAEVAAHLAGPPLPRFDVDTVTPPRARTAPGAAAPLGADTAAVVAALEKAG
jgi:crotonobetainyl-CoA:carnitine CoA-transferase CaiB-like acyl-CoA transferase